MKKKLTTIFLTLGLIAAAFAQSNLQPIAEVKLTVRAPITLGQLKARVTTLEKELGRKMTVEERKQVLDGLIDERLIVQAAEKDGMRVSDSEVNEYFNNYVSSQLGRAVTEAEFAQIIREQANMSLDEYMKSQNGMTMAEFKNFLRTQITAQNYTMRKKQNEIQSAIQEPTDAQIRSYYEVNKQSFVQPDTVKLFLALVPKENNASAAEKKVRELQKKLSANAKIIADIHSKSLEKNSGYWSQEIFVGKTPLAAEQMGLSMDELLKIFAMKKGEVSAVHETPANYQCFVILEKLDARILGLSDVMQPGSNVSLYEYIKNMVMMQRQKDALNAGFIAIRNDLRKPEYFTLFKKDTELDKTLSW